MRTLTDEFLLERCSKNNILDLTQCSIIDAQMSTIMKFLNAHPTIHTVILAQNRITDIGMKEFVQANRTVKQLNLNYNFITDIGLKDFVLFNTTVTILNLEDNDITDRGAADFAMLNDKIIFFNIKNNYNMSEMGEKALASNFVLQDLIPNSTFKIYINEVAVASEADPIKRAQYGREAGLCSPIPSLLQISMFAVKQNIAMSQQKTSDFTIDDTNGIEELVPLMNQKKF